MIAQLRRVGRLGLGHGPVVTFPLHPRDPERPPATAATPSATAKPIRR